LKKQVSLGDERKKRDTPAGRTRWEKVGLKIPLPMREPWKGEEVVTIIEKELHKGVLTSLMIKRLPEGREDLVLD